MDLMLLFLKPIKILVLLTLLFALTGIRREKLVHKMLILILCTSFIAELINPILNYFMQPTGFFTTVCVMIHHGLWLILLAQNAIHKKMVYGILVFFIAFGIINLLFYEGFQHFNYYTFVAGAFLYVIVFIHESFYRLNEETFSFFMSNTYLLLFSPIFLFLGLSLMFGFKSKTITSAIIFDMKLYDFIIYFVNIIYYALVNIYIWREKRTVYAV